jgi:hydroxypyruvate isomerase
MLLINAPPGDVAAGERGLAALPGRERDFDGAIGLALKYARALNCSCIHAMAGVIPDGCDASAYMAVYVDNLRRAASICANAGVRLLIEPLNTISAPGYLLSRLEQAEMVIDAVGHPNLWIQFDLFHLQIMGGDLVQRFARVVERVAHVQIASVPGRNEPDRGEVAYAYVLKRFEELGYDGWIGCEYTPVESTRQGLGWAEPYGIYSTGRQATRAKE